MPMTPPLRMMVAASMTTVSPLIPTLPPLMPMDGAVTSADALPWTLTLGFPSISAPSPEPRTSVLEPTSAAAPPAWASR